MSTRMDRLPNRMTRAAALLLVLPFVVVTCGGPEYKLPVCSTTVTQEPTNDLASDLVGAWSGTTDEASWHHPIAQMATLSEFGGAGGRIWMFRESGTGHVWWRVSTEPGTFGNDEEFVWEVVEGELVVNDFPPAIVDVYSDDNFLLHPIDVTVESEEGLVTRRCELDVPDDVRGLDS